MENTKQIMVNGTEQESASGAGGSIIQVETDSKQEAAAEENFSIERVFERQEAPTWREQLTFRAFFVSLLLGVMFSFIAMKLMLTTGILPSLNVSSGLLGFFFVKTWTKFLEKSKLLKQPFTRQENTVIQTCVVACYGISYSVLTTKEFWIWMINVSEIMHMGGVSLPGSDGSGLSGLSGISVLDLKSESYEQFQSFRSDRESSLIRGFGTYLFGMSEAIAKQATEANNPQNIKKPQLGWMIGFLFVVSFLGLFSLVPLRKIMIVDYKLIYPSGTATAHLINSFHTPQGAKLAKKQVKALGRFFTFSFLWGFFQWFYTAADECGFRQFPTFGLEAHKNMFYFDFSPTYVGVGMICPYIVNISLLVGSILSWGIMWPLIATRKGDWYPASESSSSLHGLQGYRVGNSNIECPKCLFSSGTAISPKFYLHAPQLNRLHLHHTCYHEEAVALWATHDMNES
ncbi:putative metal-nicotianamine transporter ysl14 [Asimina triloba]